HGIGLQRGPPPKPRPVPGFTPRVVHEPRRVVAALIQLRSATLASRRLAPPQCPPDGHENLRGVDTVLVPPGSRAMPQGVERPRVWVGTYLAQIVAHGRNLLLQGRRAIHPGVRRERAP